MREEVFANYTSNKRLIQKAYKELTKLKARQTNHLIDKWANEQSAQN